MERAKSRILPPAESTYRGRVHTPWVPTKSYRRQTRPTLFNSVSAGHIIIGSQQERSPSTLPKASTEE